MGRHEPACHIGRLHAQSLAHIFQYTDFHPRPPPPPRPGARPKMLRCRQPGRTRNSSAATMSLLHLSNSSHVTEQAHTAVAGADRCTHRASCCRREVVPAVCKAWRAASGPGEPSKLHQYRAVMQGKRKDYIDASTHTAHQCPNPGRCGCCVLIFEIVTRTHERMALCVGTTRTDMHAHDGKRSVLTITVLCTRQPHLGVLRADAPRAAPQGRWQGPGRAAMVGGGPVRPLSLMYTRCLWSEVRHVALGPTFVNA